MCNYFCFLSSFCLNVILTKKKIIFLVVIFSYHSFFFVELYVFVFVCGFVDLFQFLSSDVFVINRIANEVTLSCSSFRLIFSYLLLLLLLFIIFLAYELILFHYVNMKAMRVTLRYSVCLDVASIGQVWAWWHKFCHRIPNQIMTANSMINTPHTHTHTRKQTHNLFK